MTGTGPVAGPVRRGQPPPGRRGPVAPRSPIRLALREMKPGTVRDFDPPAARDGTPAGQPQSKVAQHAHHEWGKGAYRTMLMPDGRVRVWRLR